MGASRCVLSVGASCIPLLLGYVLNYMLVMLNITVNDMLFVSHSHVNLLL